VKRGCDSALVQVYCGCGALLEFVIESHWHQCKTGATRDKLLRNEKLVEGGADVRSSREGGADQEGRPPPFDYPIHLRSEEEADRWPEQLEL
jgi:hypothetical protein